jgi:NifU-like protein involved in Fe-S cluster formation
MQNLYVLHLRLARGMGMDGCAGWQEVKQRRCEGDSMGIFLKFDKNHVLSASFQTDGCGATVVCGSYAVEMAFGKTPDALFEITDESILAELGGLPEDHQHCAFLAAASLPAAVDDYMVKRSGKRRTDGTPDVT